MSAVNIILGELETVLAVRRIKAFTTGHVTLSSLDPSVHEFLQGTWLNLGTSFTIFFSFYFDGVTVRGGNSSTLIENLGFVLQNAEMWSQLLLTPALTIPERSQESSITMIELQLKLTPTHAITPVGSDPSPMHTVEPPPGMPTALVQSIHLRLQFSLCPIPTIPTLTLKRKRDGSIAHDEQRIHGYSSNGLNDLDAIDGASHTLQQESGASLDGSSTKEASKILEDNAKHTPRKVSFKDMVKLMDSCLRGMITTPKPANTARHLLSNAAPGPRLGQLSPVAFSPGYREAMSLRKPLLSTIAQTIASIDHRAKSPSLRNKLSQLRNVTQTHLTTSSHGSSLADLAEVKLWDLLRSQSYDPEACSKLKQLKSGGVRTLADDKKDDMLDVDVPHTEEGNVVAPLDKQDLPESMANIPMPGYPGTQPADHRTEDMLDVDAPYIKEGNVETPSDDQDPLNSTADIPMPEHLYTQPSSNGETPQCDQDPLESMSDILLPEIISIQSGSTVDDLLDDCFERLDRDEEWLLTEDHESPNSIKDHWDSEANGEEEGVEEDLFWSDFADEDLLADAHDTSFDDPSFVSLEDSVKDGDENLEDSAIRPLMSDSLVQGLDGVIDVDASPLLFDEGRVQSPGTQDWEAMLLEN